MFGLCKLAGLEARKAPTKKTFNFPYQRFEEFSVHLYTNILLTKLKFWAVHRPEVRRLEVCQLLILILYAWQIVSCFNFKFFIIASHIRFWWVQISWSENLEMNDRWTSEWSAFLWLVINTLCCAVRNFIFYASSYCCVFTCSCLKMKSKPKPKKKSKKLMIRMGGNIRKLYNIFRSQWMSFVR